MKSSTTLARLGLMFAVILMAACLSMCGNKNKKAIARHDVAEINDTLRTGNLPAAIRMTNESKADAIAMEDSATWSELMVQQGINSYYQGNPDLLISSTDSAIRWLERQKPDKERARILAKAYQTHGAYYDQYSFNPDSTVCYLRKSVDNVELTENPLELPQAYGNYANALRMASSLDSAAVYYHRAIGIADSLGLEDVHYIPLYNGIASVFSDMRDFDNSEIWWDKTLQIYDSMNRFDKFNTLTGYGNFLYYSGRYPEAEKVFSRLRKMLDSIPDSRWERMFTDVNLSDIYINLGHTSEAQALLDTTSVYFSVEQPNPVALSYIHTLQMKSALNEGKLDKALVLSERHPDSDTLRLEQRLARLKTLENLYSLSGNYQKAFAATKLYDHLNDSLRSFNLKNQISTLNAMYQRDRRILNLESGVNRQKAHIYMLIAAVGCSVAIIIALIFYFANRRIRMRLREEKMMNKIISLRQENLRNRITPHFIYNALNHELLNEKKGVPSHLDALVGLIREQQLVASEMLIPFSDELKFVEDYIKVIGDNQHSNLRYTLSINPDISASFMFPSMSLQILVENAFKHGFKSMPADSVRILDINVKHSEEDRIAVTVFNNGTVEMSPEATGIGLKVLIETIRLINERNKTNIEFSIKADSEQNGEKGFLATITLPKDLKDDNRQ